MSRQHGPNAARRRHIKRQLAARDGAGCFYCRRPFADLAAATIDHLIPYSVLRTWVQANLVLACRPCNEAKADRLPQDFLRPLGFRPGLIPGRYRRCRTRLAATVTRRRDLHRSSVGWARRIGAAVMVGAWLWLAAAICTAPTATTRPALAVDGGNKAEAVAYGCAWDALNTTSDLVTRSCHGTPRADVTHVSRASVTPSDRAADL